MSFRDILIAISVPILLGFGFVIAKPAMLHFPPYLLMGMRFTIPALILVWWFPFPKGLFLDLFKVSFIGSTLQYGLTYNGLNIIDASSAVLLVLSGAFTWSLGAVMAKPLSKKIGAFALMTWLCVFSGPMLILISAIINGNPIQYILSANFYSWLTLIYLGFFMQPVAYGAWYYVLRKYPVNKVMPVLLLLPMTGLITSIFLLGEDPPKQVFFGGTVIVFGVGMILFGKKKK